MTWDDFDTFIRNSHPPAKIDPDRTGRLVASVMAGLDAPPPARPAVPSSTVRPQPMSLLHAIIVPAVWRFAGPMAAAAILGIIVGQHLGDLHEVSTLGDLFGASTLLAGGF